MSEEGSQQAKHTCELCGEPIGNPDDDPTIYRQVTSWVSGPKLDHPKLRQQTGKLAHPDCVIKAVNGQAPDQEELF